MPEPRPTNVSIVPREHEKLFRSGLDQLVICVERIDPIFRDRGTYGGGDSIKLPERYMYLHPDAHASLRRIENDYPGVFYYSDIFRNASGSKGRREKNRDKRIRLGQSAIYTGKLPGTSAHSFGLATDHDIDDNLKRLRRFTEDAGITKEDYDLLWREYGWWCHRDGPDDGDHAHPAHESWHFNYLGDDPDRWLAHGRRSTERSIEAKVSYLYGPFTLDLPGVFMTLDRLGVFDKSDPKGSIRRFQANWTLTADGISGPQTQRTVLYVGARFVDGKGNNVEVPFP